jgi:hypothetical protein
MEVIGPIYIYGLNGKCKHKFGREPSIERNTLKTRRKSGYEHLIDLRGIECENVDWIQVAHRRF